MNVNKVILVGRLTKDPEARTTTTGKSVTSISVATSTTWKDQSGAKQEKTEFHDIVLWGKVAEIAAQYLIKGQEVYIEGRLETRNWEGKDGIKRYKTEVVVSGMDGRMQLGNKPRGRSEQGFNPRPENKSKNVKPKEENNANEDGVEEIKIEDIPF